MKKAFLLSIFIISIFIQVCSSTSETEIIWENTFGDTLDDQSFIIIELTEEYLLVGTTISVENGKSDVLAVKIDESGNEIWRVVILGPEEDIIKSGIECFDNSIVLVGTTKSFGEGRNDILVIKLSSDGNVTWQKTFGGIEDDYGVNVVQTEDGGFTICGHSDSYSENYEIILIKTNENGDQEWLKTYGDDGNEVAHDFILNSNGDYVITGSTTSYNVNMHGVYSVCVDNKGRLLWETVVDGGNSEKGYAIIETTDGNYVVTGYSYSFGPGGADVLFVKYGAIGNELWRKAYGSSARAEVGWDLIETKNGNYLAIGHNNPESPEDPKDAFFVLVNANGELEWKSSIGKEGADHGNSAVYNSDGTLTFSGYTDSDGSGLTDFWIAQIEIFDPESSNSDPNEGISENTEVEEVIEPHKDDIKVFFPDNAFPKRSSNNKTYILWSVPPYPLVKQSGYFSYDLSLIPTDSVIDSISLTTKGSSLDGQVMTAFCSHDISWIEKEKPSSALIPEKFVGSSFFSTNIEWHFWDLSEYSSYLLTSDDKVSIVFRFGGTTDTTTIFELHELPRLTIEYHQQENLDSTLTQPVSDSEAFSGDSTAIPSFSILSIIVGLMLGAKQK
jgi:hypothetical protein